MSRPIEPKDVALLIEAMLIFKKKADQPEGSYWPWLDMEADKAEARLEQLQKELA